MRTAESRSIWLPTDQELVTRCKRWVAFQWVSLALGSALEIIHIYEFVLQPAVTFFGLSGLVWPAFFAVQAGVSLLKFYRNGEQIG